MLVGEVGEAIQGNLKKFIKGEGGNVDHFFFVPRKTRITNVKIALRG